MSAIRKTDAVKRALESAEKKQARYLEKRAEEKKPGLGDALGEKIPEKVQAALDKAFAGAFRLIFEKGTGVIEKTYHRDELEQTHQIQNYAVQVRHNRRALRDISRTASRTGRANLAISGLSGVGMGLLGLGLPDIPVFTGLLLKNVYQIALRYGFGYESEDERLFILLVVQGGLLRGEALRQTDALLDRCIREGAFAEELELEAEIDKTAALFSRELLYMKFLQGVPLVGAIGGACDPVYLSKITRYANLKYEQRYLRSQPTAAR